MRNPSSAPATATATTPSSSSRRSQKHTNNRTTSVPTPCCSKIGVKRGPWTQEEDEVLARYVAKEGEGKWRTLPRRAGLSRCGKSCRLRWMNYLRPCIKRGPIADDEEDLILRLHRLLGNRWSLIAGRIPGRTDNEIKNYWNTHLSKKLISQGIDPRTHKPLDSTATTTMANNNDNTNACSTTNYIQPSPAQEVPLGGIAMHDDYQGGYFDAMEFEHDNGFHGAMQGGGDIDGDGGHNDVLSSFLDSLINDDVLLLQQQQQQQQQHQEQRQQQPIDQSVGNHEIGNNNNSGGSITGTINNNSEHDMPSDPVFEFSELW